MQNPRRIGICDPVPVFRSGLRSVLSDAQFAVDEPDDIVDWAQSNASSSVVLSLQDETDWNLLDGLRSAPLDVSVVALLSDSEPCSYREALRSGAHAALPRYAPGAQLVKVVRAVFDQQVLLPSTVARALADWQTQSPTTDLSDEECRWLRELALGVTVDDLAWRSGYSRRTMFRRLQTVYRQLGTSRRDQALLEASRRGLV